MPSEDPLYAKRWSAYRLACGLGVFGIPLLGLGTAAAFYEPELFGSMQYAARIALPVALAGSVAWAYLRIVRLRCPRCAGRFFAAGAGRFPNLLLKRCSCCCLRLGAAHGDEVDS